MSDRPAYLLLLASDIERRRFADLAGEMSPQLIRHGGRHLALAPAPLIEPFGHHEAPISVMLACWNSIEQLRDFWHSPARRRLCREGSRFGNIAAVALEGSAVGSPEAATDTVLTLFLGAGPSPALLEAAGARALALVRERLVEPLEGAWTHGDVAIYGWPSTERARRQMILFSSGQRGRALLVPALPSTPVSAPAAHRGSAVAA